MRLVSLAPSATEILFALGCGSQLVGHHSNPRTLPEMLESILEIGNAVGK